METNKVPKAVIGTGNTFCYGIEHKADTNCKLCHTKIPTKAGGTDNGFNCYVRTKSNGGTKITDITTLYATVKDGGNKHTPWTTK